jgi:phosphohistidine phosphatase
MGRFMAEEDIRPHRVLCSGALRAVQTWELVARGLEGPIPTQIRDDIYHASPDSLLGLIRALPEDSESVLVLGHNPTFEHLALRLAGSGDPEALGRMRTKYPTGTLAILNFPVHRWQMVGEGTGVLSGFVRPKDLK